MLSPDILFPPANPSILQMFLCLEAQPHQGHGKADCVCVCVCLCMCVCSSCMCGHTYLYTTAISRTYPALVPRLCPKYAYLQNTPCSTQAQQMPDKYAACQVHVCCSYRFFVNIHTAPTSNDALQYENFHHTKITHYTRYTVHYESQQTLGEGVANLCVLFQLYYCSTVSMQRHLNSFYRLLFHLDLRTNAFFLRVLPSFTHSEGCCSILRIVRSIICLQKFLYST